MRLPRERPLIPAMRSAATTRSYAAAVIAAGALLGPNHPAVDTDGGLRADSPTCRVIRMFMAGVLPGLLLAGGFFA